MEGYVATIGMFDGVHLGHRFVLRQVVQQARERGLRSMVITFDHSPRDGHVLTPLARKVSLLAQSGVDRTEVLTFNDELRHLTARQFMQRELKERLGVRVLLTGYDNRFGYNRAESFDDYVRYGCELGIEVLQLPPMVMEPSASVAPCVSSTLIRQQLLDGDVGAANRGLGYAYSLAGHVEHGEHIGSQLGFPTANVRPDDPCQLVPAAGVYAVKVWLGDSRAFKHGMMNIGCRPTFDGQHQTLEVNIFRLEEDLYGRQLTIAFVARLRDERRFDDVEALKQQLRTDAARAEEVLNIEH